jgi:hypothetical protein
MKRVLSLALFFTLAACGGGTKLSLSSRTGTAASPAASSPRALALSNGITIDRLRVVIREVELERASAQRDPVKDLEEFEVGPFLLDLQGTALNGTVQRIVVSDVPAGPYRELKFKVHKPSSSESADPNVKAMADLDASIVVEGQIDGQPYTFMSAVDAEQKFEGSFDLAAGINNVTLNLDPSSWFGGAGAARLDPRQSANRSQIENNIQISMKAFDDDDRDGQPDHQ